MRIYAKAHKEIQHELNERGDHLTSLHLLVYRHPKNITHKPTIITFSIQSKPNWPVYFTAHNDRRMLLHLPTSSLQWRADTIASDSNNPRPEGYSQIMIRSWRAYFFFMDFIFFMLFFIAFFIAGAAAFFIFMAILIVFFFLPPTENDFLISIWFHNNQNPRNVKVYNKQ